MTPTPDPRYEPKHPRTIAGGIVACLGAVALTLGLTGSPATAAEGFSIDLYTVVRDEPGTETSLGSWAVPEELQGRSCVATSTPENNSSIHPGNDLRIVSASTITLNDVEGTGNPVASVDQITLGDQVEVTLIMGPDGVYSAGLAISFDCPPPATTTTSTTTSTTSTTSTTTAPPPCEFDSQLPADDPACVPTTTTTAAPEPLVGNNPPTTSSTTTSTTTTSTTMAAAAPTTVQQASASPTPVRAQLPRTGSTDTMLVLGALLLLAGGAMVLTTRREHELG